MMYVGLYGLNGVNPDTSPKLIQTYVAPILLYGMEAPCIATPKMKLLEQFYRDIFKQIQYIPDATANAACYLLLGILLIKRQLHGKSLNLVGCIIRRVGLVEREVAIWQMT